MISYPKRKARNPPFVLAFKTIIRNPKLSPSARLLLLILKSYSDSSGLHCYPGEDTLAKNLGASTRTVQRLVAELRKAGLLSTVQRKNKDGKLSTTAYLLDDLRRAQLAAPPKKARSPDDTSGGRLTTPVADGEPSKIVHFTEKKRDFI